MLNTTEPDVPGIGEPWIVLGLICMFVGGCWMGSMIAMLIAVIRMHYRERCSQQRNSRGHESKNLEHLWAESHSSISSDTTTSDRDYEDDEDSAPNVTLHPDILAYNIPRIGRGAFFEMTVGVRALYEMDARAIHYWRPYENNYVKLQTFRLNSRGRC